MLCAAADMREPRARGWLRGRPPRRWLRWRRCPSAMAACVLLAATAALVAVYPSAASVSCAFPPEPAAAGAIKPTAFNVSFTCLPASVQPATAEVRPACMCPAHPQGHAHLFIGA